MQKLTLFCISVAFIIGTALGNWPWAWLTVSLLVGLLLFVGRGRFTIAVLFLCLTIAAAGYLNVLRYTNHSLQSADGPWTGRALTRPELAGSGYFRGRVRLDGEGSTVLLYSRQEWKQHDGISFTGNVADPLYAQNPGELDYQSLLVRQGVKAVIFADGVRLISRYRPSLLDSARSWVADSLSGLPEQDRGLAFALVLGDRRQLTVDIQEQWRAAGASHLLAVSGLHVSVVGGAIFFLLRRRYGMRGSWMGVVPVVLAYAALIGHSMSAWRAALAFVLLALANVSLRRQHWPTTIAFVAAVLLGLSPRSIADPGYQLSFAAAIGILILTPVFSHGLRLVMPRPAASLLSASLAAQIATLPILAVHFSVVPIYGLVSSFVLIPLAPPLLITALGTALLGKVPLVGHVVAGLFGLIATPFFWLTRMISAWPLATVHVLAAPALLMFAYYAVLVWIPVTGLRRTRKCTAILLAVLLVVALPGLLSLGRKSITFLSVGNADAIHVQIGGKHFLIDTADAGAMKRQVAPYLASQGVNRLQTVFITHSHSDHVGGLAQLSANLKIMRIIAGPEHDKVKSLAGLKPILPAVPGLSVSGRNYVFRIVNTDRAGLSLNNRSASIAFECDNLRVLFAADWEKEAEALLLPFLQRAHVLKVAHHGSASSTTAPFIATVKPELAVVSVGANRYGHPASSVIDALQNAGAQVLRTDEVGAVRLVFSGQKLRVYAFSNGRFHLIGKLVLSTEGEKRSVIDKELPGAVATAEAA